MTGHFKCSKCTAHGHLVSDRDTCPNCGGAIYPVVIITRETTTPCSFCEYFDAMGETCTNPHTCELEVTM